jgi:ribosomal protein S18 acetylase RimI-like enzyme
VTGRRTARSDATDRVRIVKAGAERIPDLRALWESRHEHHAAVAPELAQLGPVRAPADSWTVRKVLYAEWLSEPDAFALLACIDSRPIGYALVHMRRGEETWATSDRIAELETLAVLPGFRGRGVGSLLIDRVYDELRRLRVGHLSVSVIASNVDAVRFYKRLGLLEFLVSFMGPVPAEGSGTADRGAGGGTSGGI